MRYAVIVSDPPWKFADKIGARGAEANYPCMTQAELIACPRPRAAKDAVLFMWRVASMTEDAYALCRAWGFAPKSEIVWVKKTKHDKVHFGMGRSVRMSHESCIIATRGRPMRLSGAVRSVFEAPIGRHSAKPDRFYQIVESLYGGPRAEMFARRPRDGWDCFGNEL